jgi:hypothetical protein
MILVDVAIISSPGSISYSQMPALAAPMSWLEGRESTAGQFSASRRAAGEAFTPKMSFNVDWLIELSRHRLLQEATWVPSSAHR